MNRQLKIAIAAATTLTALLAVRPAQAASVASSLTISASVAKVCVITAGSVAFGNYDPVGVNSVTPLDQTGTFTVACTKNTGYTVSLGLGGNASGTTRRMTSGGATPDFLSYELYLDSTRTSVWDTTNMYSGTAASITPVTLTVYGRVPAAQNVADGAYADTVVSTVNF